MINGGMFYRGVLSTIVLGWMGFLSVEVYDLNAGQNSIKERQGVHKDQITSLVSNSEKLSTGIYNTKEKLADANVALAIYHHRQITDVLRVLKSRLVCLERNINAC